MGVASVPSLIRGEGTVTNGLQNTQSAQTCLKMERDQDMSYVQAQGGASFELACDPVFWPFPSP